MQKILLDFLPIVLFFTAFKFFNLMVATAVAIGASLLQVLILRLTTGKFEKVSVISFLSIAILGGATLLLKNEIYIKWKPTAVYWFLSGIFLLSQLFGKKPLLQRLGETRLMLKDSVWRQLNLSWFGFFFILGVANLYVVYNFDNNVWVNFKLFGIFGIFVVFIILQALFMTKCLTVRNRD